MDTEKDRPHLLFTRGNRLDETTGIISECYTCIWPVKDSPCGFTTAEFSKLIDHFKQHGLILQQGINYCSMCQTLFTNKIHATEHYIRHSLDMEALYREGHQTEELDAVFERLASIRKEILECIFLKDGYEEYKSA